MAGKYNLRVNFDKTKHLKAKNFFFLYTFRDQHFIKKFVMMEHKVLIVVERSKQNGLYVGIFCIILSLILALRTAVESFEILPIDGGKYNLRVHFDRIKKLKAKKNFYTLRV